MVNPVPGYKVTTPFGKRGPHWATGVHGGDDWAAPRGTKVVAPWSGVVVGIRRGNSRWGTTWGAAFGTQLVIDFDKLPDGSAGLWGVLAHLSEVSVSVGQRVKAGQKVGEVGSTGNATGPHLHFEVQPQERWVRGSYRDPQRWVNAQKESTVGDNHFDYGFIDTTKELVVGRSYVPFLPEEWNPKRDGLQFGKTYFKILGIKWRPGKHAGALRIKAVRTNPTDPTWYRDIKLHEDFLDDKGESLDSWSSFELGEHERNIRFEIKAIGGLAECRLSKSRYAGFAVVPD